MNITVEDYRWEAEDFLARIDGDTGAKREELECTE